MQLKTITVGLCFVVLVMTACTGTAVAEENTSLTLQSTDATATIGEQVTVEFTLEAQADVEEPVLDVQGFSGFLPPLDARYDDGGTWDNQSKSWSWSSLQAGEAREPSLTFTVPDEADPGEYDFLSEALLDGEVQDTAVSVITITRVGEGEWSFQTNSHVVWGATVVDGTAFVSGEQMFALDSDSGEVQWSFDPGTRLVGLPNAVDNRLYATAKDGNLYVLDKETGDEIWRFEGAQDGLGESVNLYGGNVYFGSHDDNVYSVDAETGEEVWRFETGDDVRWAPTVIAGTVYVGSDDGNLYALDAETGDEVWSFQTQDNVGGSPTYHEGTVYVGSFDHNVYALDAETGEEQWRYRTNDQEGIGVQGALTVHEGKVYAGDNDGFLYAIDSGTGNLDWSFETGGSVPSSATVADGVVYFGSFDESVYGVDTETGDQVWRFKTGDRVASAPIVVNGTVFVGSTDGNIYALDAETNGSSQDTRILQHTLNHHSGEYTLDDRLLPPGIECSPGEAVGAPDHSERFDGCPPGLEDGLPENSNTPER